MKTLIVLSLVIAALSLGCGHDPVAPSTGEPVSGPPTIGESTSSTVPVGEK
jgi:hypothetical protein